VGGPGVDFPAVMCVDTRIFPSWSPIHRIVPVVTALTAALVVASCGGDAKDSGGGNEAASKVDVAALGKRAFGPNAKAHSGRIDGEIEITLGGVPRFSEPFSITNSGVFSYRKGAALPDYALDVGVRDNGVTLTSVGGRSYVSIGSTGYEVPAAVRRRLVRTSSRGRNGLTRTVEQFGISIGRWEIDKRAGPTEVLDGVQTRRVDTGVDVGRVLRDTNILGGLMSSLGISRAVGLPSEIPPAARRILVRSVRSSKGASWIGVHDGVLRKAGLTIVFAIPKAKRKALGGISRAKVVASMNVTEVGRPQKIARPSPLGNYADFRLGLDALAEQQP
jgi:hypothetical protein